MVNYHGEKMDATICWSKSTINSFRQQEVARAVNENYEGRDKCYRDDILMLQFETTIWLGFWSEAHNNFSRSTTDFEELVS